MVVSTSDFDVFYTSLNTVILVACAAGARGRLLGAESLRGLSAFPRSSRNAVQYVTVVRAVRLLLREFPRSARDLPWRCAMHHGMISVQNTQNLRNP